MIKPCVEFTVITKENCYSERVMRQFAVLPEISISISYFIDAIDYGIHLSLFAWTVSIFITKDIKEND